MQYEIGDIEFNRFRDIIYREAGIKLGDLKKSLVQARLSRRIRSLGLETFCEYYTYLMDNYDDEKINFINSITTNKTDFFREEKHFDFLQETVFPAYVREGRKKIRIWSAGCSTGEEPYSIAITALDFFDRYEMPDIKILATDIDTQVLATAEQAIYEKDRIACIPDSMLRNYFNRGFGRFQNRYRVKDRVRGLVSFRRLNLLAETYPMKNPFDIIFCRNVIIYFDKATQVRLFRGFSHCLKDDGYMFIGHSENILSFNGDFTLEGNTIYRRKSMAD